MTPEPWDPTPVPLAWARRQQRADDLIAVALVRLLAVALKHDREVFDSVLRDLGVRSSRRLDLEQGLRALIEEQT